MASPALIWSTVRHLSLRQVRHQLRHRLAPPAFPRPLEMGWAPARIRPLRGEETPCGAFDGADGFRFNNCLLRFTGDWNPPTARKLWTYNLHYMGWLSDLPHGDGSREAWIRRWIRDNPRRGGGNGWEPYPLSLRIINWCRHYAASGRAPEREVLASLGEQAATLLARLEFHLDGNHLLENLFGLCVAGFHFDPGNPRCRRARARVQDLLETELARQFLPDGGHYELSPMYHALLLGRMLDILACWPGGEDPYPGLEAEIRDTVRKASTWLHAMTVAGRITLFNDSCYDGAPEAGALLRCSERLAGWAAPPPLPLVSLGASGYYRAENGPLAIIFDAGPLGPDHQMGHAQGDLLSFCLWLRGHPILVPPGNYEYVPGAMRNYCRATSSHNTVALEGAEQAEWWGSHRAGRRARPIGASAVAEGSLIRLRGGHDGFPAAPGRPEHHREIEVSPGSVIIRDRIARGAGRIFRAYFHFHPDCRVERTAGGIRILSAAGEFRLESDATWELSEGWHCPEFGLKLRNPVAAAVFTQSTCRCVLALRR